MIGTRPRRLTTSSTWDLYAYRRSALDQFCNLPEAKLEAAERLEQLRLMENGIDIYIEETPFGSVEVDTEEDLRKVEEILRSGKL